MSLRGRRKIFFMEFVELQLGREETNSLFDPREFG